MAPSMVSYRTLKLYMEAIIEAILLNVVTATKDLHSKKWAWAAFRWSQTEATESAPCCC